MRFDSSMYSVLLHMALGGAICLFTMYILLSISPLGIEMILFNLGCFGLVAFSESVNALSLFLLGTTYLPSGFLGGLYTGYKIKENLTIILVIPALIGVLGLIALRFFTGYINLSSFNFQNEVFIPFLGGVIGVFLGGYAMNWETEEAESSEAIELDPSQIKS
mgnify:CR=1 FL=1